MRFLWQQAVLVASLLGACTGPGDDIDPLCNGKCDGLTAPLTHHALAVSECDRANLAALEQERDLLQRIEASQEFKACLSSANDASIQVVEENIEGAGRSARTQAEIQSLFQQFRYASLCADVESSSKRVGDELTLQVEECKSNRERSLAEQISALVDYTGRPSPVVFSEQSEQFPNCYASYESALSNNLTEVEAYATHQALVVCTAIELTLLAQKFQAAQCESGCDPLLLSSYIEAGFVTAIDTSTQVCELLSSASINPTDAGQLLNCRITAIAQLQIAVNNGLAP